MRDWKIAGFKGPASKRKEGKGREGNVAGVSPPTCE